MKQIFMMVMSCAVIGSGIAGENMKITIDGNVYDVVLDNNDVTTAIIAAGPMGLQLVRYAEHEYYADMPFTPRATAPRTSQLLAGHIYYWGGGNAFVVNFADYDISPYSSVHIGRIADDAAVDFLRTAGHKISVEIGK